VARVVRARCLDRTICNELLQVIVLGCMIGLLWWQMPRREDLIDSRLGAIFFGVVFAGGFFPLFTSIFQCTACQTEHI
jgi:hypothetical protein